MGGDAVGPEERSPVVVDEAVDEPLAVAVLLQLVGTSLPVDSAAVLSCRDDLGDGVEAHFAPPSTVDTVKLMSCSYGPVVYPMNAEHSIIE